MSRSLRIALVAVGALAGAAASRAQAPLPPATLDFKLNAGGGGSWGPALNVLLLMTVMTLVPAILVSVTSFTRILVSLHFLRQALGTQTAPGNQTLIGLALFLSYFVMAPVATKVQEQALTPALKGEIDGPTAIDRAWPPLREFLLHNTRAGEIALFEELAHVAPPAEASAIPARVLVPAFMISELKTAFLIGVLLYLPFLMIELIVSSVLLALGMLQLPPVVVSTPLKILLFVVVDGWSLVVTALVKSFA